MRKFLLTLTAFALALAVNAQGFKAFKLDGKLEKAPSALIQPQLTKKAPLKITLAANQRLAGLYTSDTYASQSEGMGYPSAPGSLGIYSYWPKTVLSSYEGKQLKSIRFALAYSAKVTAITIYGIDAQTYVHEVVSQDVTTASSPAGWTTVELTNPWKINTGSYTAFLVGFTYNQTATQSNAAYPLSLVSEGEAQNVFFYGNLGQGEGFYNLGSNYGNLSVQAIVEGEFPSEDMRLTGFATDNNYYKQGGNTQYELLVNNFGSKKAKYEISLTLDGNAVATLTNANANVKADSIEPNVTDTISGQFTLPANATIGNHELKAYVTKINDEAPTASTDDDTISTDIKVYAENVARQKNLIEHHTSSSCTYCYLGDELLETIAKQRTDLAWVSIHNTMNSQYPDPAKTDQTDSIGRYQGLEAYPSAAFNRTVITDEGSYVTPIGYNEQYIPQAANTFSQVIDLTAQLNPSFVTLTLTPSFDSNNNRKLTLNVKGTGVNGTKTLIGDERLYVYLAEDSVKFNQLTNGRWISNDNHNQVFRAALGTVLGNEINWNGNDFDATYTYDIPSNWIIENMKAVAFVAPKLNIEDVNLAGVNQAEQVNLKDSYQATGIKTISNTEANSKVVARYNAAGQRIAEPQRGLNILKFANGETVKVIVK